VFSFGHDWYGRLGHEDRHDDDKPQILPREIEALRGVDVASICLAGWQVLALTYNGKVYQWGLVYSELQLAYHDTPSADGDRVGRRPQPRRIEALVGVRVRSVAADGYHVCAVTHSGELFTWGGGENGCLGHGDNEIVPLPKRVEQLRRDGICVVGVSAGSPHTLAVESDGRVYGVGVLRAMGAERLEQPDKDEDRTLQLRRCTMRWLPVGDADFKVVQGGGPAMRELLGSYTRATTHQPPTEEDI
jgi:alpha-tubulin suppressor-like RCC1 family protein